jgi:predicted enzyme related to lactoylglutathione lyase
VTFYIEVDDPAAALEKVSQLGGRTIQEPMDVPGGPTIALFADPEGHLVGLVKAQ